MPLVGASPFGVGDLARHRRPEGAAVADAAHDRDLVLLEAHARPAAVAEAASGQLAADVVDDHRQPGRQALDDDDEGASVGLAGGEVPEHALTIPGTTRTAGTRDGAGRPHGPGA